MKIFNSLIFVASLINATHIHSADIDHKDSWLGGILKYATSKNLTRSQSPMKTIRTSTSRFIHRTRKNIFIDYWSEKYDHLDNHDNEDSVYEGVDYGDDSDEELYDDIENYDTKTALENLELGWGLNSTSFVGLGFPKNKMQSNSHHKRSYGEL